MYYNIIKIKTFQRQILPSIIFRWKYEFIIYYFDVYFSLFPVFLHRQSLVSIYKENLTFIKISNNVRYTNKVASECKPILIINFIVDSYS